MRRFSSAADGDEPDAERYFAAEWVKPRARLSAEAGAHRFVWDLRYPRPRAIEYQWSIAASPFEGTTLVPGGPLAPPGDYRVTLIADGVRREVPLKILADPRVATPAGERRGARVLARARRGSRGGVARLRGDRRGARGDRGAPRDHRRRRGRAALAARLAALDAALEPIAAGGREVEFGLGPAAKRSPASRPTSRTPTPRRPPPSARPRRGCALRRRPRSGAGRDTRRRTQGGEPRARRRAPRAARGSRCRPPAPGRGAGGAGPAVTARAARGAAASAQR